MLRLETADVAVRHVVRERRLGRLAILGVWVGGTAAAVLAPAFGTICGAFLVPAFVTAVLLGRSHRAPIAGVRVPGRRGVVTCDEDGVSIEVAGHRRCFFPRAAVAGGWTERFGAGSDDV